jgi:hypothetical protein
VANEGDGQPGSSSFLFHDDVVDEARLVAQFLPVEGLNSGVDVPQHLAASFSDKMIASGLSSCVPRKPRVALVRAGARRHEAVAVEVVMRLHQQRPESGPELEGRLSWRGE